jgi:predicted metalloprotease with PDZ domain
MRHGVFVTVVLALAPSMARAQAPIEYRLRFPEPEHRWMQVEVTLPDLPAVPLQLHMSRSSPGRYALHEFAKNVYDVHIADAAGRPLQTLHRSLHEWDVAAHGPLVRVTYKVFGDRVDGTYLAIDTMHAHINMPAAIMWGRGLEMRPITIHFEPPAGLAWRVATQLFPSADERTFTAPNLQYLMDSPSEFGTFALQAFSVEDGGRRSMFRIALHHRGTDADLVVYARETQAIVREERKVFGGFPVFDGGTYTFIVDYLPWANGDGMEHRNSAVLTSSTSLANARDTLIGTVAHEFFHSWNVKRIRPKSLEPFNLDDVNASRELWLAEGVTNYYEPLILMRAGLTDLDQYARTISAAIDTVTLSPARQWRTVEEMSEFAPLVDAATSIDRTNFDNTFLSYYTWGEAIGLGLDLALRDRSESKISLDDVMRAMWQQFGRSGESVPGYVARPYTADDVRAVLAQVAGDAAFAVDFYTRFVQGHDIVDYQHLLARAGLVLRRQHPGAAYAGDLALQASNGGVRIAAVVAAGSPAYAAGLERDDVVLSIAGTQTSRPEDVESALKHLKPGTTVPLVFRRRGGAEVSAKLQLTENPHQEVVTAEAVGQALTDAQRRFRNAWLGSDRRAF